MSVATASTSQETNRKLTMMICDDSNIIRRKIERELKIDNLEVVATAANGRIAVDTFKKQPVDVVTMDITMPEMDGIECVEKLVQIKPDVLILVISALSDKATAIEALRNGANGFLCKPFTDRQLTEALAELLRGAQ
ncbi:MAG: response regulator transcription factor [Steroidobacteraceae bacterium]